MTIFKKLNNLFSNSTIGDQLGMRIGPFIVNCGRVGTQSSAALEYSFAIPYTYKCFSIVANSNNDTSNFPISAIPVSLSRFQVKSSAGSPAAYYISIGI